MHFPKEDCEMNRRQFLKSLAAAGFTVGFGSLFSCKSMGSALSSEDQQLLHGFIIADAHAHPYQFYGSKVTDGTTPTIKMLQQVGMVACSFSAVGDNSRSGPPFRAALHQLSTVKKFEGNNQVKVIRKASDVPGSVGPGYAPGAIMAIEGGDALEGKIENLNQFYEYGVRLITVVHNRNNEIGYNQVSKEDGPLSKFGVHTIERMNELGMIIDVAHSRNRTLKEIRKVSSAPLIDSHTNPRPFGTTPAKPSRLRTWSELEVIADSGGVVCTWPLAYSGNQASRSTLNDWAKEIVEIKKRIGIEHVGLGTDGGGNLPRVVKGWRSITSLPRLVKVMEDAGLSREETAAYLGGNFLRLIKQCLG